MDTAVIHSRLFEVDQRSDQSWFPGFFTRMPRDRARAWGSDHNVVVFVRQHFDVRSDIAFYRIQYGRVGSGFKVDGVTI